MTSTWTLSSLRYQKVSVMYLRKLPRFDDPRVRLVKGWFNDTLPPFLREFRPHPTLILHLDADLYSSTIFVLRQMKPHLRPGTRTEGA